MARLRLRFDPACELPDGLLQWWFVVGPQMTTIAELAAGIVSFFRIQQSCPNGVNLLMDDFGLPPMQSVDLLNDRDLISVKPAVAASAPRIRDDGRLERVLRLTAVEEFEKESGGYRSENEDLTLSRGLDTSSERSKRKRTPQKDKVKRLKTRETVDEEVLETAKEKKRKEKKKSKKRPRNEPDSDQTSREDEEEVVEKDVSEDDVPIGNGTDAVEFKAGEENLLKRPSRSARRKKAKRAWLRAAKDAPENKLEASPSVPKEAQAFAASPIVKEAAVVAAPVRVKESPAFAAPVVVAPGHIRFEPSEETEVPIVVTRVNFGNGLIKTKKQGQSWGQGRRPVRVQEELQNGTVKNDHEPVPVDDR